MPYFYINRARGGARGVGGRRAARGGKCNAGKAGLCTSRGSAAPASAGSPRRAAPSGAAPARRGRRPGRLHGRARRAAPRPALPSAPPPAARASPASPRALCAWPSPAAATSWARPPAAAALTHARLSAAGLERAGCRRLPSHAARCRPRDPARVSTCSRTASSRSASSSDRSASARSCPRRAFDVSDVARSRSSRDRLVLEGPAAVSPQEGEMERRQGGAQALTEADAPQLPHQSVRLDAQRLVMPL